MNKLTLFTIIAIGSAAAACASEPTSNTANPNANASTVVTNTNSNAGRPTSEQEETPVTVKAVFPEAQSFTTQHKQLTDEQVASIEKASGETVTERDFHSYLAFSTAGGTRRQLGAASVLNVDGKELIVVYESRNGMPTIKEIRAEGISPEFLNQFVGKNHDAKIIFGEDIKAAGGVADDTARSIAQSVRKDVLTMEALYGAPHSH